MNRLLLLIVLFLGLCSSAQVKIGDNPTSVNPSSALEIESSDKGLLFPRVALLSTTNPSPLVGFVAGMTVYNTATAGTGTTAVSPGLYFSDGSKWLAVGAGLAEDQALGSIAIFPFASVPSTYLVCNGAAVSRTTYASLFAKIGTTYGAGDGSTTFNLPDLRGEFIRGWDNGRGVDAGRVLGSNQSFMVESHNHNFGGYSKMLADGNNDIVTSQSHDGRPVAERITGGGNKASTGSIQSYGGTETRPRNVAMVYAIKAMESLIVSGGGSGATTTYNGSTSVVLNGTSFERAALTGDVTAPANSNSTTIAPNAVTTAKISDNAVTVAKLPAGATATTFLRGDGTWVTPTDTNTTYTGGSGVSVSGTTISATDATTTAKGIVQLAGDLTGTAAAPSVANNAITSSKIADGTIANADLASGVGGIYKGSGSLSGTTTVTMGTNTLTFSSTATSGSSHFSVDGSTLNVDAVNNRVGIGTNNPTERLNVNGGNVLIDNSNNPLLRMHSNVNTNGQGGQIEFNEFDTSYGTRLRHNTNSDASNAEGLYIEGKSAGVYTPFTVFDQVNFRVGIGTVSPGNRLEVNSGTAGNSGLRFSNINSSTPPTTSGVSTLGVNSNGDVVVVPGENSYDSGEIVQVRVYSGSEITGTYNVNFINGTFTIPSFTPKSSNSTILIEADGTYYVSGWSDASTGGVDHYALQVKQGSTILMDKRQVWNLNGGAGTRSSVLFPVMARFTNTSTAAKSFNLTASRIAGDDLINFSNNIVVKITEIQN